MKTLLFCFGGAALGVVLGGFVGATSADEPAYIGGNALMGVIIGGAIGLVIGLLLGLRVDRRRA